MEEVASFATCGAMPFRRNSLAIKRAERGLDDWKSIVEKELGSTPGHLASPYRTAAEALYQDFYAILVEGHNTTRFTDSLKKL